MHKERLLNVAKALRESKRPEEFTMGQFVRECGSPACALGHYAERTDLQSAFVLKLDPMWGWDVYTSPGSELSFRHIMPHFDISEAETEELFGIHGCDDAQSPNAAARYIEAFVARKEAEAAP